MKLEVITRKPEGQTKPTPLLFVHGICHAAWCWDEYFLPYFAKNGYEAHAVSLRGHGDSEGHEKLRWTRLKDYVEDVAQVVDSLSARPVVIGHSMGGMVVQKYLMTHEAPGAVLLASAPPTGVLQATLRVATQTPWHFLKVNLTMNMYPILETPKMFTKWFVSPDMPQEQAEAFQARMQAESYIAYLGMLGLELPNPKKIKAPMLVIGGRSDALFSTKEIEYTAKKYHTQAQMVAAAHDIMLEANWRHAADHILSWLPRWGM